MSVLKIGSKNSSSGSYGILISMTGYEMANVCYSQMDSHLLKRSYHRIFSIFAYEKLLIKINVLSAVIKYYILKMQILYRDVYLRLKT